MAKIAWKVINGYGPYAYLQESVKTAGKVISKHLAYLGKAGTGGLFPGKHVTLPAVPGFAGGRVVVPLVTGETLADLNPKPKAAIKWMAKQVKEGLPASAITSTPPTVPKSPSAKGKGKAKPKMAKPKAVKTKTAQSAPPAPKPQQLGDTTPPKWTKIGEQLGSTPGGLYEDEAGVKHYVKHPVTEKHRKNELLAMAIYRLANVAVPETFATEVDGKPGVASRYIEGLTGSGTNPKDLVGTKEGFAVDAWLANWDVVGVGATKYDNILDLDGHAYRIDAGGALLYRGTGGPKSDLFGEEVTELEGLRDKKLNPVSETVFGDMTLQEIAGSAVKVTTIPDSKIAAAVQEHFGDDPALAQELTAQAHRPPRKYQQAGERPGHGAPCRADCCQRTGHGHASAEAGGPEAAGSVAAVRRYRCTVNIPVPGQAGRRRHPEGQGGQPPGERDPYQAADRGDGQRGARAEPCQVGTHQGGRGQ